MQINLDFFSNMTLFLLLGPVLEEKYGSKNLLEIDRDIKQGGISSWQENISPCGGMGRSTACG